jgi:hypothetical protein
MQQFTIQPNEYLNRSIQSYWHQDYEGGGEKWKIPDTIENVIGHFKTTPV